MRSGPLAKVFPSLTLWIVYQCNPTMLQRMRTHLLSLAARVMTNPFCLTLALGCMSFCVIASAHWPPTKQELAGTMSELSSAHHPRLHGHMAEMWLVIAHS